VNIITVFMGRRDRRANVKQFEAETAGVGVLVEGQS
jgi:hypothetical protein